QQLPDPALRSYFLTVFGRPERKTACACERNGEVTMPQLMHLVAGDTLAQKLHAPEGRLAALLKTPRPDGEVIQELYLMTLARRPAEAEVNLVLKQLADGPREEVYRDLFWALVNAKEFVFNH